MSEGVLQQIGTPQDVYARPANVFVATFLGAPPMNLIDGALESADGGWRFRGQDVDVPLSTEVLSAPELEHEIEARSDVKLGLRPEHLRSARRARTAGSPARAVPRAGRLGSLPHGRGRRHDRPGAHRPGLARAAGRQRHAALRRWRVHVFGADGHNLRRDAPVGAQASPSKPRLVADERRAAAADAVGPRSRGCRAAARPDRVPHREPGEGGDALPRRGAAVHRFRRATSSPGSGSSSRAGTSAPRRPSRHTR